MVAISLYPRRAAGEKSKEGSIQSSMPPYFTRYVIAIVPRCQLISWENQSLMFLDTMGVMCPIHIEYWETCAQGKHSCFENWSQHFQQSL